MSPSKSTLKKHFPGTPHTRSVLAPKNANFRDYSAFNRRLNAKFGPLPYAPAKASDYVMTFEELKQSGCSVVIYPRVSSRTQKRKRKLKSQEDSLRLQLRRAGIHVLAAFRECGSGWDDDLERRAAAAEYAARYGAILVVDSVDRLLRSRLFRHNDKEPKLPTDYEFQALFERLGNVRIASIVHPNTPWKEVRKHQIHRGYGVHCEPGEKKARREKLKATVLWMHHKWKHSLGEIAADTGVAKSTIEDWIVEDRRKKASGFSVSPMKTRGRISTCKTSPAALPYASKRLRAPLRHVLRIRTEKEHQRLKAAVFWMHDKWKHSFSEIAEDTCLSESLVRDWITVSFGVRKAEAIRLGRQLPELTKKP